MNEIEFFHLLKFLNTLDDFALIALLSSMKEIKTKKEVRFLLIELFGYEHIKLLPEIKSKDLILLIEAEYNIRHIN